MLEDKDMTGLELKTLSGDHRTVSEHELGNFRAAIGERTLIPGEDGYGEACAIWNAMIDRRPGLIAQCSNAGQVQTAVRFAAEHDLLLAVRGGGHNIAGNSVCDGGLLVDLSPMRSVSVDSTARTVTVAAGALLGDVDAATQKHGLAVPLGINATTGVAGLTLGGGYGWLSRRHGLTIDNLRSVDIVFVDGRLLHASADEETDLFWAVRGGGGNFGVVTQFEYAAHPVGPEVLSGLIVHPGTDAPQLLRQYRDLAAGFPDDLTAWVVLRKAPPLPFLSEEWHGKEVLVFACCWAGDMAAGEAALAELRALGEPIADVIGPHQFSDWQKAFDPLLTPGARNYWKSHNFSVLSDGLIELLAEALGRLPTAECEIFIPHLGGATKRVNWDSTAFAHRSANFLMNVHTRWQEADEDSRCIAWARELFDRTAAFATGGVYSNFTSQDDSDRANGAFGANYTRLSALKARYDPENRLRMNMNIRPAA